MNLQPLFETQAKLDKRIVEKKGLQGQDLLDKKILSLQVELGELANELPEVFKFWSNKKNNYKKALEEYCDCLHFILSIGLEHNFDEEYPLLLIEGLEMPSITEQFTMLMRTDWDIYEEGCGGYYHEGLELFLKLGEMLGFTWEQIEESYFAKNKINHERQANGY